VTIIENFSQLIPRGRLFEMDFGATQLQKFGWKK